VGGEVWVCERVGSRWRPLFRVEGVRVEGLAGGGLRLSLPWRVVFEGNLGGFREVGLRLPAGAVRRWLSVAGVRVPRRVKRMVVYAKGGEVHVDVASRLTRDEAELLGLAPHWRELVFFFVSVAAACLAAGVDRRLLSALLSLLGVEPAGRFA